MRLISILCAEEGMKLGKTLYAENGAVLLREHSLLSKNYIERIKELGYASIYIEDDLTKEIELDLVISDILKQKSVNVLKNTFLDIEMESSKTIEKRKEELYSITDEIVNEISSKKDLMVNMIDLKYYDEYTFYHSVNVASLSIVLGVAIGLNKNELFKLGLAALLHDIGKIFIPKEILGKPSKLTDEEYSIIQTHSRHGYNFLKDHFQIPSISYISILHHHERYDGLGYPLRKKQNEIPLYGKIICIADVYDALTSNRPYRRALLPTEAMEYIMGNGGSIFDPEITHLFTRKVAPFPVGTCVRLSDGSIGFVVKNYSDCSIRPKIKIVGGEHKNFSPYYLDLKNDLSSSAITITDVIMDNKVKLG